MVCSCLGVFVFNPKLSSPVLTILNLVIPWDVGLLSQSILVLRGVFRGKSLVVVWLEVES